MADLTRSLDLFFLAFLPRDGFAKLLLHVLALLVGNILANIVEDGNALFGREWNADLLFLEGAMLLGVVGALLTVDAMLLRYVFANIEGLLVAYLLRLLRANGLGNVLANQIGFGLRSPDRGEDMRRIRSCRRHGCESALGLL